MASSPLPSPPLPLSSLRLLLPPLRLHSASLWQAVQRRSVKHYGMLEDFVAMVTEAVPELLTDRQTGLLLLALRAKVTLSDPDMPLGPAHLNEFRSVLAADPDLDECRSALLALSAAVAQRPAEAQRLLQEVFDHNFDSALLSLLSVLLSRIELMFPVPDFKQAASWLDAAAAGVEDSLQDTEQLRQLLTNQSCRLGQAPPTVGGACEKTLLSVWSHPLFSHHPDSQSDAVLNGGGALELVKVEVVLTAQGQPGRAVIGQNQPDAANESAAVGGAKSSPAGLQEDRRKDSPGDGADQSQDTAVQSEGCSSEVGSNALDSISHNSQRVAHRCPGCGRCFIYRSQVVRHLRTSKSCGARGEEPRPPEARPIRAHACFQCSASFQSRGELRAHQRTHRARPVYRCGQCDRQFQHLSSLTNHRQTHLEGGGGFSCRRCHLRFRSEGERDQHRAAAHRPDRLSCSVCAQDFNSQTLLLRHLQTHSVEGATPSYACRHCQQSFSGVTQLRIHQRSHASLRFQCDQCSRRYGSATGLQAHRRSSHSADSRFLCPQCGKRFRSRDGLEGHLRTHSGERPHCCPYCPKAFAALAGLNVHVRRHTGERPYVCAVCGKGWPSGSDLQKHMRTHTGERPYVCQDCGKAFAISCHLTEHRRIHTGEKPFCCPECGKCLRRKFDLNKHVLSHNVVRPHACSVCPKSYTRKTHLARHLKTHEVATATTPEEEEEVEREEEEA